MSAELRAECRETISPWKFGGSRRATLLCLLSMDSGQDEETGTTEWHVWCARFGRNLLYTDDQGFVWCERCENEDEAMALFRLIDQEYSKWSDEEGE